MVDMNAIAIRAATSADAAALAHLAALDDRALPAGPYLLAETDGRLVAATGAGGSAVADPFEYTAEVVDLLRARSRQLASPRRRVTRLVPVCGDATRARRARIRR